MNIKNVVIYTSLRLINDVYFKISRSKLYNQIQQDNSARCIYLFANPTHPNIGDMAQTICIEQWFKRLYPKYKVFEIPHRLSSDRILNLIKSKIRKTDLIFIHSGFIINDPNRDLYFIMKIIPLFRDNKIVILPQTIDLHDVTLINRIAEIFEKHPNLLLLCRDNTSLQIANRLFGKCQSKAFPDFVTSMIGRYNVSTSVERDGILFVLRNDGEKFYTNEQLSELKSKLHQYRIKTTDTTIKRSCFYTVKYRNDIVKNTLEEFSKYRLVVTDRYHGLIFSQVVSTHVIVLRSSNHKLTSGIDWFPKELFKNNIHFAEDLDAAYQIAVAILRANKTYLNPPYFYDKFFQTIV